MFTLDKSLTLIIAAMIILFLAISIKTSNYFQESQNNKPDNQIPSNLEISDDEVAVIQGRMKRYSSAPKEELQFNVGDKVEIISGSFMGSFGKIESIDMQHSKLTVMVEIFNRLTPVEVNFDEIHSI